MQSIIHAEKNTFLVSWNIFNTSDNAVPKIFPPTHPIGIVDLIS